jgi:uncharacterized delta-60 repeat protein
VARYNTDGPLDISFNTDGKVTTAFETLSPTSNDFGNSIAIQSDGKIVVAGSTDINNNNDFAVVRYNTNGTLDTSFNTSGKVITPFSSSSDDIGTSIAIQSDGKIIVAGYSNISGNNNFAVVRYNTNGTLDTSFNTSGKVTTAFSGLNDFGNSIAIQLDGKIVVAGSTDSSGNNDFAVVRYNTNGSLDMTFGTDGKVITAFSGSNDFGNSIAIQSDGKIVVAGSTDSSGNNDFAVVRYNTNGSLDMTFGTAGKVITPFSGSSDDVGYGITIQSDGKIVVAGNTDSSGNNDFAVVRYNTDGSLDTTFDTDGKVITPFSGSSDDFGTSVTIQSDGKIVVAGYSNSNGNNDFAVVRYLGGLSSSTTMQPVTTIPTTMISTTEQPTTTAAITTQPTTTQQITDVSTTVAPTTVPIDKNTKKILKYWTAVLLGLC